MPQLSTVVTFSGSRAPSHRRWFQGYPANRYLLVASRSMGSGSGRVCSLVLSFCGRMFEGLARVGHFVCRARIMYSLLSILIALLAYSIMVVGFVGSIASSVCVRSGRLALNLLM